MKDTATHFNIETHDMLIRKNLGIPNIVSVLLLSIGLSAETTIAQTDNSEPKTIYVYVPDSVKFDPASDPAAAAAFGGLLGAAVAAGVNKKHRTKHKDFMSQVTSNLEGLDIKKMIHDSIRSVDYINGGSQEIKILELKKPRRKTKGINIITNVSISSKFDRLKIQYIVSERKSTGFTGVNQDIEQFSIESHLFGAMFDGDENPDDYKTHWTLDDSNVVKENVTAGISEITVLLKEVLDDKKYDSSKGTRISYTDGITQYTGRLISETKKRLTTKCKFGYLKSCYYIIPESLEGVPLSTAKKPEHV